MMQNMQHLLALITVAVEVVIETVRGKDLII